MRKIFAATVLALAMLSANAQETSHANSAVAEYVTDPVISDPLPATAITPLPELEPTAPLMAEVFDESISTPLAAGKCLAYNFNLPGAMHRMVASVSPTDYAGPVTWYAYVSEANYVMLLVCALEPTTPIATSFQVRVN